VLFLDECYCLSILSDSFLLKMIRSSFTQDKDAFAAILKRICRLQKTNGPNYVVLSDQKKRKKKKEKNRGVERNDFGMRSSNLFCSSNLLLCLVHLLLTCVPTYPRWSRLSFSTAIHNQETLEKLVVIILK